MGMKLLKQTLYDPSVRISTKGIDMQDVKMLDFQLSMILKMCTVGDAKSVVISEVEDEKNNFKGIAAWAALTWEYDRPNEKGLISIMDRIDLVGRAKGPDDLSKRMLTLKRLWSEYNRFVHANSHLMSGAALDYDDVFKKRDLFRISPEDLVK